MNGPAPGTAPLVGGLRLPMARAKASSGGGRLERLSALSSTPVGSVLRRALLVSFAVLLVSLVVRQARAQVTRMPAYRIRPDDVAFVDLSPAADARMRQGLADALPLAWPLSGGPSLFAPGLEPTLRALLRSHPMVREVTDVETRFPRRVRARVVVRTPLAALHARGVLEGGRSVEGDVPVDAEGVVLDPAVYAGFLSSYDVVHVDGVRSGCPGVGQRWIDSDEQVDEALAAARVANRLNAERSVLRAPRVVRVDVSGFPAPPRLRLRGEVVLRLEDGRTVQWGRTERSLVGVTREDGYDAKRVRLMDLLNDPARRAAIELDVRFPLAPALSRGG